MVNHSVLAQKPQRTNNLDLLRLLFATTVFFVHVVAISGSPYFRGLIQHVQPLWDVLGLMAVNGFFVISGFLILMSYESSRSLKDYSLKRAKRIYPAYFTVVMLCAVLGLLVSQLSASAYFNLAWLKYVFFNLTFLNFIQPALPGVFSDNLMPVVNGALWTIKVEVMFYLVLPLLAFLCRKTKPIYMLAVIYLASLLWLIVCLHMFAKTGNANYFELAKQLPGKMVYFAVGMGCYYYFDFLKRYQQALLGFVVAAWLLLHFVNVPGIEPVTLGLSVIYLGYFVKYLGNFARYGDMSYGVYIYHFPVLQVFVACGLFAVHPLLGLLGAAVTVFSLAYLSWHVVEKRWLGRASHYVQSEEKPEFLNEVKGMA